MKVFPLFLDALPLPEADRERLQRVSRAGGHLLKAVRHGAKVNPAAVWVDAAISVCDAVEAWARYEQAREITRQLQSECAMLRHLCVNALVRLRLDGQRVAAEAQGRRSLLDQRLREQRRDEEWLLKQIADRRSLIEQLRGLIDELRTTTLQAPQALLDLEASVETLVRAQLRTLLESQQRSAAETQST